MVVAIPFSSPNELESIEPILAGASSYSTPNSKTGHSQHPPAWPEDDAKQRIPSPEYKGSGFLKCPPSYVSDALAIPGHVGNFVSTETGSKVRLQ